MGPVDEMRSTSAKLFASGYALFSGLIFITVIGVVFAPIAHRLLHRFHISENDIGQDEERDAENKSKDR